jgi:hypothetical protein
MNRYTLILSNGRIQVFSVLACAVTFQQAYGGTLITQQTGQVSENHLPNPVEPVESIPL